MPPELAGWSSPSAWAGWGLAAILFLLMGLGRVVSVRTLEREVKAADQRAEDWKEAHALERKAREIQAQKDDEILTLLRTLTAAPTGREPAA